MTGGAQHNELEAGLYWPVRLNLSPGQFNLRLGGKQFRLKLSYPSYIETGIPDVNVPAYSLTLIEIAWTKPHQMVGEAFASWATTSAEVLLEEAEACQNHFIDLLFTSSIRLNKNLEYIRHFGVSDWAATYIKANEVLVRSELSPHAMALVSENRLDIPAGELDRDRVSFLQRTLQRAYRIATSGYPTESLLLSAAVIDASTQSFLEHSMQKRGLNVEASKELLRNTTTKRLKTYLDPVLKIVTGRSLCEENPGLYKKMIRLNEIRNDAIHNGRETSRTEAVEGCRTAFEILSFLNEVDGTCIERPLQPFI